MIGGGSDDPHLLLAGLHREALLVVSRACGTKQQGLSVAARQLGLSQRWKRKLRELDSTLGHVEKVSPQSCHQWMYDLGQELERVLGAVPPPPTAPAHPTEVITPGCGSAMDESSTADEQLPPEHQQGCEIFSLCAQDTTGENHHISSGSDGEPDFLMGEDAASFCFLHSKAHESTDTSAYVRSTFNATVLRSQEIVAEEFSQSTQTAIHFDTNIDIAAIVEAEPVSMVISCMESLQQHHVLLHNDVRRTIGMPVIGMEHVSAEVLNSTDYLSNYDTAGLNAEFLIGADARFSAVGGFLDKLVTQRLLRGVISCWSEYTYLANCASARRHASISLAWRSWKLHAASTKAASGALLCSSCANSGCSCDKCNRALDIARNIVFGSSPKRCTCGGKLAVCRSAPVPWVCTKCHKPLGRVAAGCPSCQTLICLSCI